MRMAFAQPRVGHFHKLRFCFHLFNSAAAAVSHGGTQAAVDLVQELMDGLQTAMLLTGSRTLADLGHQPVVMGTRLTNWINAAAS